MLKMISICFGWEREIKAFLFCEEFIIILTSLYARVGEKIKFKLSQGWETFVANADRMNYHNNSGGQIVFLVFLKMKSINLHNFLFFI